MYCYYHKDFENKEMEIGEKQFCSEEEHELWADKIYGKRGSKKTEKSIDEIKKRLLEFAEEEKLKKRKGLFE